jgi:hypothetical protein
MIIIAYFSWRPMRVITEETGVPAEKLICGVEYVKWKELEQSSSACGRNESYSASISCPPMHIFSVNLVLWDHRIESNYFFDFGLRDSSCTIIVERSKPF